jgi:hypothetical protein
VVTGPWRHVCSCSGPDTCKRPERADRSESLGCNSSVLRATVGLLGPDTLKVAIESIPQSDWGKMLVLEEVHLIRPLKNDTECCNFVVQTNQTLFKSRVSGDGSTLTDNKSKTAMTGTG